jgi:hypothetical protein
MGHTVEKEPLRLELMARDTKDNGKGVNTTVSEAKHGRMVLLIRVGLRMV